MALPARPDCAHEVEDQHDDERAIVELPVRATAEEVLDGILACRAWRDSQPSGQLVRAEGQVSHCEVCVAERWSARSDIKQCKPAWRMTKQQMQKLLHNMQMHGRLLLISKLAPQPA